MGNVAVVENQIQAPQLFHTTLCKNLGPVEKLWGMGATMLRIRDNLNAKSLIYLMIYGEPIGASLSEGLWKSCGKDIRYDRN